MTRHTAVGGADCDRMRVAISARLDGEPLELSAAVLDDHVSRCAGCGQWAREAAAVGRTMRVRSERIPDLTAAIMARVEVAPARHRVRALLRPALVVVGLVQIALAVPDLFGDPMGMHLGTHAAHESAAWNVAVGVAFVVAALRPRRAAGLIPLLVVFVAILAATSWYDLAAGTVAATRLLTHLGVLIGLALVAAVARPPARPPWPIEAGGAAGRDESSPPRRLPGVA